MSKTQSGLEWEYKREPKKWELREPLLLVKALGGAASNLIIYSVHRRVLARTTIKARVELKAESY